jgi:hypothetical protein
MLHLNGQTCSSLTGRTIRLPLWQLAINRLLRSLTCKCQFPGTGSANSERRAEGRVWHLSLLRAGLTLSALVNQFADGLHH